MSREEYDAWCAGATEIVGVFVEAAGRREPVPLAEMRELARAERVAVLCGVDEPPGFRPPRSWRRLSLYEERALRKRWGDV